MAKYKGKYSPNKEYAELEKTYQTIAPKSKKHPSKKKDGKKNRGAVIGICVGVIALAIIVLVGCIFFMQSENGVIHEGVYVAGVPLGGMTKDQAEAAVRSATRNTLGKQNMVVTVLDDTIEIPASAVKSFDIEGAVQEAYHFGRRGSKAKQAEEQRIAAEIGHHVDLTSYLKVDSKLIKSKLDELGEIYSTTLKETTYEIVGEAPTMEQIQAGKNMQTLVIQLGVPEFGLNMDELYKDVMEAYSSNTFLLIRDCEMIEPTAVDLEAILAEHLVEPVDAMYQTGTKDVIPGKYGYGFDLDEAKNTLESAKYGSIVEIPFTQIQPEITEENIQEMMFNDLLATWTAEYESDANRATNLRLACEAIDGMVIYPGEVFSYNQALGERTEARGYKPGASYSGNQTVYTIGGGICQVSSALYHCAMHADLEIVRRDNHGYVQSYVPLGMDATVSWDYLDFMFRNNTKHPIRIEAKPDGGRTVVSIYGVDDKDYIVKVEYEILSETPSTNTTQQMTANNTEGFKDGDFIVTPYNGYKIVTYRCKYNKVTDELISKKEEAVSEYRVRNGIICEIVE